VRENLADGELVVLVESRVGMGYVEFSVYDLKRLAATIGASLDETRRCSLHGDTF
jgi:hypothetical protein